MWLGLLRFDNAVRLLAILQLDASRLAVKLAPRKNIRRVSSLVWTLKLDCVCSCSQVGSTMALLEGVGEAIARSEGKDVEERGSYAFTGALNTNLGS